MFGKAKWLKDKYFTHTHIYRFFNFFFSYIYNKSKNY